ncbi:MAG: hypothetical protein E6K82_25450 [Candidatus Rokuibacteriota bacterium]|nr:MAG: hypothetical protein E6K82_25450 [Candidatus Rokubacteria bacterium]
MTDHWGFVVAAYALAVVVLGGYWRRLVRKEREVMALRDDRASRSRQPSMAGHPRSGPASRTPLQ